MNNLLQIFEQVKINLKSNTADSSKESSQTQSSNFANAETTPGELFRHYESALYPYHKIIRKNK